MYFNCYLVLTKLAVSHTYKSKLCCKMLSTPVLPNQFPICIYRLALLCRHCALLTRQCRCYPFTTFCLLNISLITFVLIYIMAIMLDAFICLCLILLALFLLCVLNNCGGCVFFPVYGYVPMCYNSLLTVGICVSRLCYFVFNFSNLLWILN